MKNFVIFVANPVKLDDEFLAVERRANRKEMCAYRNAIIVERLRRQNKLTGGAGGSIRQKSSDTEEMTFRTMRWGFLIIAAVVILVAINDLRAIADLIQERDYLGTFILGILTLLLFALGLGNILKFSDEKWCQMTTFQALAGYFDELFGRDVSRDASDARGVSEAKDVSGANRVDDQKGAAATINVSVDATATIDPERAAEAFARTLRHDSDTVLDVKQNRLDSLLGF